MMKCVQKMGNALLLPVCIWKSATPRDRRKKIKSSGARGVIRPNAGSVQAVIGQNAQFVAAAFKNFTDNGGASCGFFAEKTTRT